MTMTHEKQNDAGKYPDEYGEPIETRRKCIHCGNNLGTQNPGYECGTCKFIKDAIRKRF